MKDSRWHLVVFLFVLSPLDAEAQVTSFDVERVDNSAALSGFVTNDIQIDYDGQYLGAQMIIELTSGSIYQDPEGNRTPPDSALFGTFPSLEFDTFLALGSLTSDGPFGPPSVGGGAVDLGGHRLSVFDETAINQAWNPSGVDGLFGGDEFKLARLTLSEDAQGTFQFLAVANGDLFTFSGQIANGRILPEPNTLLLCGLGLGAVLTKKLRQG